MTATIDAFPGMSDVTRAFIVQVRDYTRDHPQLNRLIAGQESSDRQIAWAVLRALSYYNGCPPLTQEGLETLLTQYGQLDLMIRLTVVSLLEGILLLQVRNHVNYSTGGTNIGVNDKSPLLMNVIQYYRGTADQMMQRVKTAINITNAMGIPGVFSEYWALNTTYSYYI